MANNTNLKNKLIEGVDDDIWSQFTGWCKMNRVKVGKQLTEVLKTFLNKNK